jgi:3-methylfumaryl-CoA hydratase
MSACASITDEALASWATYVGRREVRREFLAPEPLRRFAVACGLDAEVERNPPSLAHWAYFLDAAPAFRLGADGHPTRGVGLLPPITLPRRMFAAASMRFIEPLALGEDAELTSTLVDLQHRRGSTGDLILAEVERALSQLGRERVKERQTIVYREAPRDADEPRLSPAQDPSDGWRPTAVDLFRFSAATFNAHRIHYDLPYARDVEGYPDLVVHGPLTAAKLCGALCGERSGAALRGFDFRASAPLFAGDTIRLMVDGATNEARAVRPDGVTAMTATARF